MIGCLITLIFIAIVCVIVLYVAETAMNAIFPLPPPVWLLIRLAVVLLVLLYALQCFGVWSGGPVWHGRL